MLTIDLHNHTKYSHGAHTPAEMYAAGLAKGLTLMGFSEHSPRPAGFNYKHEYREALTRHLPDYVREVTDLKHNPQKGHNGLCQVLFGMELDWLEGQEDFIRTASRAYDFDYLIGSVHFLDQWGFDDGNEAWLDVSQEVCEQRYEVYFTAWEQMLRSGLYQIAAHPDLIKIFSLQQFHLWLQKEKAQEQIRHCLEVLRASGMAMEISSAGLRKACHEIYPAPLFMTMARELKLPISFASDAHRTQDVAWGFEQLEEYARSFGFKESVYFDHGQMFTVKF